MIELVVLDIANTTVDEHNAVYRALEEAVVAAGGSPTADDVQRWMGAHKREAIEGMVTESTGERPSEPAVDAAFADFHRRLDAAYAERPPVPLPGVPDALAKLRAEGIKVALNTGFDRTVIDTLLPTLGWDDSVLDAVVCVDDVAAGRPAPYMIFRAMERTGVTDVGAVLAAGDTVLDLRAGTNAGVAMVVGVLTGELTAAGLGTERHTHLVPSVADLPSLLGVGAHVE
ncbi:MAG: phosphonatase-like hydrolase [Actinophytocola sp.]|nr:phosphonatase-like hydrolase [Actinophytocola sp.]